MASGFNGQSRSRENGERILVLGVGGGGCNAVARMAKAWQDGPSLVVADTDSQVLASVPVERRISLGRSLTRGLSAGGDPATGKLAAEEEADTLRR